MVNFLSNLKPAFQKKKTSFFLIWDCHHFVTVMIMEYSSHFLFYICIYNCSILLKASNSSQNVTCELKKKKKKKKSLTNDFIDGSASMKKKDKNKFTILK
jgi:hypothetical protein